MNAAATASRISRHAAVRAKQRGIQSATQEVVFTFGDIEESAGGGLYKLKVSKRELRSLTAQRTLTPAEASRCMGLIVVTDGQTIVTVYRKH